MGYKKIMILTIILACLLAVSAVSAAENVTEDIVSADATDEVASVEISTDESVGVEISTDESVGVENPTNESVGVENQDEKLREDSVDVLSTNPFTFTALNEAINGNRYDDIYLLANYKFEPGTDDKFIDGISIGRPLTIWGNGFTIDGSNAARIFNAKSWNIVFRNLNFINGNTTGHGGAINGRCTVINCNFANNQARQFGGALYDSTARDCTFNNNQASDGGAMYSGTAYDCTFNNNQASTSGGAMRDTSAYNCIFNGNQADYGGAMNSGSAYDCTFNGNQAINYGGGAMHDTSAYNCTFKSNKANSEGGAMNSGYAYNCTFKSNQADCGGAMSGEGYKAENCIFTDNTAKNGGAAYQITATNSQFTNNKATENGGAMFEGIVKNSNFTRNHANQEGGAVYNANVDNCLFEYNSATNGGAMSGRKATNSKFNHNSADNYGGAVYNAKLSINSEFNNNNAPNGANTYNVTLFDPESTKTFADLNELINSNSESDVYLNDNYTFDLSTDWDLIGGVVVDRAVNVWGNGFTIDGDNTARMFTATNNNVVFHDINFINGKSRDYKGGGAINGYCSAINCKFTNNQGPLGGAIYGCSVYNCTFNSNQAISSGGAIYGCSAYNCTFNSNQAISSGGAISHGSAYSCTFNSNQAIDYGGGAIYDGSAYDCTFNGNQAINYGGGAMNRGSAYNCTFNDNQAASGGAISECSAYNCTFNSNQAISSGGAIIYASAYSCTFNSNQASYSGGAICNGSAYDCTFNNNQADYGGAMSCEDYNAENCIFTNNTAKYGGAMYEGTADTCVFKGNKATISGNDTCNTTILKPVLSVSNFATTYNSGAKLTVSFTTASGTPIKNAKITVRVYKNNALAGTYYFTSSAGWKVNLDVGIYKAVFSAENQGYAVDSASATLNIKKDSTKIVSPAVSTIYNGNKYLIVTLKDSKNRVIKGVYVTIKLGSVTKKLKTNSLGQVKLTTNALAPKKYAASVTFNGDNSYLKSTKSVTVTVNKAPTKIIASSKAFNVKATKKITATLKDSKNRVIKNKYVTFKVDGKTYNVKTNSKGVATATVKITKKGSFATAVSFAGDACYNKCSKSIKITVKK